MLGEVPTSVTSPPRSEPKAIGIRNSEAETPERRARRKAAGISIASAPMFLTSAESTITAPTRIPSWPRTPPARADSRSISDSISPVRPIAALTTSALATMITMSSEKPLKARSGATVPAATEASSASIATRS